MKRISNLVLMLYLVLSGALCYASGAARTENEKGKDGVPIGLLEKSSQSSSVKSGAITPTINGHVLTVVFNENLGQVAIEITTATGDNVQTDSCFTPNGLQFYIPLAGDHIVTFTLPNGDEYYGEFTVTD